MQFIFNAAFHLEIFMVCWFWCYFLLVFDGSNKDESSSPITGTITSTVVALDIPEVQSDAQASTDGISTEHRRRL